MRKDSILFRPFFEHPMTIIRICTGIGFIIQGLNVFHSGYMIGHISIFSDLYHLPAPEILAYLSKGAELLLGIMLVLGAFTRVAALMLMINMAVATLLNYYSLDGNIFSTEDYQTQLSWFYMIIGFAIFVSGPTAYSLDEKWTST